MRAFNGALAHFQSICCERRARKTQYQSLGLKKLSLRPVFVFDVAEAEINQLSLGTLIDCIETG